MTNGYDVFLGKMRLPITPSKISVKISNQNATMNLLDNTQINLLKPAGLSEISLECRLPCQKYPYAVYPDGFRTVSYYLGKLERLKQEQKPFQFIVYRNGELMHMLENKTGIGIFTGIERFLPGYHYFTNIKVSLENYEIKEDASEGFDTIVSISLKQYVPFGTLVEIEKPGKPSKPGKPRKPPRDPGDKPPKTSYIIKKGDCLYRIAAQHLGKGSRWKEIYQLNKTVIENESKKHGRKSSSNGWWIYPGTKIILPK